MKRVDLIEKKRILDSFFKVDETKLRFERFNGEMSPIVSRLCFERGDSAAAILFDQNSNSVILVNQFKYPTYEKDGGWILETVAGAIDENEEPTEAIKREIQEETGYRATAIEHISTFYVTPGGSSERIFLYYAEVDINNRYFVGGGLEEENEDIEIVIFTPEDLFKKIEKQEIVDAKTIISAMWLQRRMEGKL